MPRSLHAADHYVVTCSAVGSIQALRTIAYKLIADIAFITDAWGELEIC